MNDATPAPGSTAPGFAVPEERLWRARPSQIVNWQIYSASLVIIIACAAVLPFPYAALGLLALLPCGWYYAVVSSTHYDLTTQRLRITRGPLTQRTEEIELYRVEDTGAVAPVLYRAMSLGNVELRTTDRSAPVASLEAVSDHETKRDRIRDLVEKARTAKGVRLVE